MYSEKKVKFKYIKSIVLLVAVSAIVAGGVYYVMNSKKQIFDLSNNNSFENSISKVEKNMKEDRSVELHAAIGYLSYKYAFTTPEHSYFTLDLNKSEQNRLQKIFYNKDENQIIEEAKYLAKEEKTNKYNTSDINAFIKSHYAMMLNTNSKDKNDQLKLAHLLSELKVQYLEDNNKLKLILNEQEYKKITSSVVNRNLIKFSGMSIGDIDNTKIENIKVKNNIEENNFRKIISSNFYDPQDNTDKIERINTTLMYLKQMRGNENYFYNKTLNCSIKNYKVNNYKITNQTIDGVSFNSIDLVLTNKDSDYDSINVYTIFQDKDRNYYVQNDEVLLNNIIKKNKPTRIKMPVKNTTLDGFNTKAEDLTIQQIIPDKCSNSLIPKYEGKKELNDKIQEFERNLVELKKEL